MVPDHTAPPPTVQIDGGFSAAQRRGLISKAVISQQANRALLLKCQVFNYVVVTRHSSDYQLEISWAD